VKIITRRRKLLINGARLFKGRIGKPTRPWPAVVGLGEGRSVHSTIDDMKRTTKVQRGIKVGDIFDLSIVKKANEELKSSGWRP
jgi:hypothetical protein